MKIVNRTSWKTSHLQPFVSHVAADELETEQRKNLIVIFDDMSHSRHGYARLHRYSALGGKLRIGIRLPKNVAVDRAYLALLLAWGMARLRNVPDELIKGSTRYSCVRNWREFYGWTNALPLVVQEPKPAKPKPTKDEKQEARIAAARKAVSRWQTTVKRSTTHLKKWERRLAALERAAEARRREEETREETLGKLRENLIGERTEATS